MRDILYLQAKELRRQDFDFLRTVMDAKALIAGLRELKPFAAARYKVREMGLFGSFVRGEQSAASDVDVLVEFDDGADLLDLTGLGLYLEEALQRKVDVVPKNALRKELRDAVLAELVQV
jgi:uncharacterized protein